MSDLSRLRELAALLQPKVEPAAITEAKSLESDFNGIKGVVDDALADLHDKLGRGKQLEEVLQKYGLLDLEQRGKKFNGSTVCEQIADLTTEYKKNLEKLLVEVEIMISTMAESVELDEDRWSTPPEDIFKSDSDYIVDALKKGAGSAKKALATLMTYMRGAGKSSKNGAELLAAKKKLQAMCEGANHKGDLLVEAFKHLRDNLVMSANHFGDRSENPEGYAELQAVLKLFGKKVPADQVWSYDSDSNAPQFLKLMRQNKVQNPDSPDMNDLKRAGFEKVKRLRDAVFFKKDNMIVVLNDGDGAPPTVFMTE